LFKKGIDVGLTTVYRVLNQFEKSGIVTKLNFDNQSIYELATNGHHDHLVCVKCNHIEEFQDSVIEDHQEIIAKNFGYKLTDHRLFLYGICQDCQNNFS
jgi:Fur family ferric uptake transcriptional regulator